MSAPATPTGLAVTALTATRVTLAWNRVAHADWYELWRDGARAFGTTGTTVSDPTVMPLHAYAYQVSARNPSGPSALSAPVAVTTPAQAAAAPGTPAGVSLTVLP